MVSLINTPSVLGLGAFLSFTFLSHTQIICTQEKMMSFFFFFRKHSLHKIETWPQILVHSSSYLFLMSFNFFGEQEYAPIFNTKVCPSPVLIILHI